MTLSDFEQQVFAVAKASGLCGIPLMRRLTATSVNLRVDLTVGGFLDAFYNEQTGTTAFALIQGSRRVFGAITPADGMSIPSGIRNCTF